MPSRISNFSAQTLHKTSACLVDASTNTETVWDEEGTWEKENNGSAEDEEEAEQTLQLPSIIVDYRNQRQDVSKTTICEGAVTKVHVDHHHYNQWARSPVKRQLTSILFRGIQQLQSKARMCARELEPGQESFAEQTEVTPSPLKQGLQEDRSILGSTSLHHKIFKKQLSNCQLTKSHGSIATRPYNHVANVRSAIKLNHAYIKGTDSIDEQTSSSFSGQKLDFTVTRDFRPRIGFARIRDRCPLPVSVNSPRCVDNHVFLVNEPFKYSTTSKQNTKHNYKKSKQEKVVSECPATGGNEGNVVSHEYVLPNTILQRSQTDYLESFTPRKLPTYRIPASVASAELFDFSHLTDIGRTPADVRYLHGQRTNTSLRGSKLTHRNAVSKSGVLGEKTH